VEWNLSMNRFPKSLRVGGLALLIAGIIALDHYVLGVLNVWDPETGELRMTFLLGPTAFILGSVLIVGNGPEGEKHLSRGCAIGALLLMAFIAVVFLSVLLDMGSWGS
jgi:hypothetical protein